jgi:thiol-disulfide isomerase/thioredoxin
MKKCTIIVVSMTCFILLFSTIVSGCKKNIVNTQPIENPPIEIPTTPPVEEIKDPPSQEKPPMVDLPLGLIPKDQRQFAPEFDLPKLDGTGNLSLSSLKGKIVLIDFTTTWCIWCTRQEPQVEDLYKKYEPKGFTVIAIDCREPKETVLGKYPGGKSMYPVILDEDGNVSGNLFGVQGYPFYSLIDQEGKVAYFQSGFK